MLAEDGLELRISGTGPALMTELPVGGTSPVLCAAISEGEADTSLS